MQRRTAGALVVLLALLAVVALLLDERAPEDARSFEAAADAADADVEAALLARATPDPAGGAALRGRPPPSRPDAGHGPVDVTVVGAGGVPLPWVRVVAGPSAPSEARGEASAEPIALVTDEVGRARFLDLPYDGSWRLGTRPPAAGTVQAFRAALVSAVEVTISSNGTRTFVGRAKDASVPVEGPRARLVLLQGLPIRLVEVAGPAGRALRAAPWAVAPTFGHPRPGTRLPHEVLTARAPPGRRQTLSLTISDRTQLVAARERAFPAWVSPLARELRVVLPSMPEADLLVSLPDGLAPDAVARWKPACTLDGHAVAAVRVRRDGLGRIHVAGVPAWPGQEVKLHGPVGAAGRLTASGRFPAGEVAPDLLLEASWVPRKRARKVSRSRARKIERLDFRVNALEVQFQALGLGVLVAGVGRQRLWVTPRTSSAPPRPTSATQGALRLLVRRADGAPAAGAEVRAGRRTARVSPKGRTLLGRLGPGVQEIIVLGAGPAFVARAEVTPGEITEVELDAPEGGTLEVRVVDAENNPLPFARVTLAMPDQLPYADLEDGVQRIDPYTDTRGRRTFCAVTPGVVTVTARYGNRRDVRTLKVADGRLTRATLVLPTPLPTPRPEPQADARPGKAILRDLKKRHRDLEAMRRMLEGARRAGGAGR